MIKEWKIKFIDDSKLRRIVLEVAEAAHTVVVSISHNFGALGDVSLAVITLDAIRGIENVLNIKLEYVVVVGWIVGELFAHSGAISSLIALIDK